MIRILSIISLLFFVISSITGSLYWGSTQKVKRLESTITQLKTDLKECSEGKNKLLKNKEQDEKLILDNQLSLDSIESEKDSLLDKISKLESKRCKQAVPSAQEVPYEIDIDDKLPADLKRVLPTKNKDSGSGNTTSR